MEAYAVANPDQPALLGAVKAHVHTIFATLNEATFATLPLQKRGGEVRVRAILNLSESTLGTSTSALLPFFPYSPLTPNSAFSFSSRSFFQMT